MLKLKSFAVGVLAICLLMSGCDRPHPGNWKEPEVKAQVMKSLKLTELTLTPDPTGGYSATGKNADGESFKIKITQDVSAKRLSWDSKGDRGSNEVGEFVFEQPVNP